MNFTIKLVSGSPTESLNGTKIKELMVILQNDIFISAKKVRLIETSFDIGTTYLISGNTYSTRKCILQE